MDSSPQVGESANLLLKRLVDATRAIVSPGASVEDAPQDGRQYARVNGEWRLLPDPVIDGVVETYSQLPIALGSPKLGDAYLVMSASGTFFVNRKPAGLYVRKAVLGQLTDWVYAGDLTDSEE